MKIKWLFTEWAKEEINKKNVLEVNENENTTQ